MTFHQPQYSDISFLLLYFNANAYDPEQLTEDLASMPALDQEKANTDMAFLLSEHRLGLAEFHTATSCTAKDGVFARRFFEDVYRFAFENGEEPDISKYWNR
ncbi:hypothetical protein [Litoreibacter halocynthiae]|uniref:hypothetical protein n=1 Tax=Litoreibacter halocynthiae TaxID=1242689 RepID=UPI002492A326|nr:hypothetical protein [Litoreibacter halocynthiae]